MEPSPNQSILAGSPTAVRAPVGDCQPDWQSELRTAVRDVATLCQLLEISPDEAAPAAATPGQFPVFAPASYVGRIARGDLRDPLLLQVLPRRAEAAEAAGFAADPVDDAAAELAPGLLKKYAGRALLVTTGACAVHCRYCFRRHFPYSAGPKSDDQWQPALAAIRADRTIREVILSGGDPLTLPDRRLRRLVEQVAAIPHVARLRVHSRLPIMIPSRVTDQLLDWLTATRLAPVMVLHANHCREIDHDVAQAVARLRSVGVMLLNQAVLLAGVNDSADAQCELSERLVAIGVVPYYLHQLDRVVGAAHFEVAQQQGEQIVAEMRRRLPGYAVPRYVRETPGQQHKTVLL